LLWLGDADRKQDRSVLYVVVACGVGRVVVANLPEAALTSRHAVQQCIAEAQHATPCIVLLVHFPVLFKAEQPLPHSQETQETRIVAALQQALEQVAYQQSHLRLLLVATAESLDSMSGRVRSACFHTEIENKVCACDALCESRSKLREYEIRLTLLLLLATQPRPTPCNS
jgi:hypothetical protein